MTKKALVLAGHGSHISPNTAGWVWTQVDALRARGAADEVTAAFWKEAPTFATVLDTVMADDVTVVPLFTAAGYFSQVVIPSEMALNGSITRRGGKTIRYARTLGEHQFVGDMVRRRVMDALRDLDVPADQVGVAVIGHGTGRSSASRDTTFEQAAALLDSKIVPEAVAVFLDDTPSIPDLYDLVRARHIIAVPNFLALGSHTTIDVPEALGLPEGERRATIRGRDVWYTDPIGVDKELIEAILDLAGEARGETLTATGYSLAAWSGFPTAGRDELIAAVKEAGEMTFGQLRLSMERVQAGDGSAIRIEDVGVLRDLVRTRGGLRPQTSMADLPMGWCVAIMSPEQLHAVVETVYPGMVADWAARRRGDFKARSLDEVLARQQGQYRQIASLSDEERADVVMSVCGGCVRHPTWRTGRSPTESIPCPEPCNLWLTRALERCEVRDMD